MRFNEIINEASSIFYHGSGEDSGKKILSDGMLKPGSDVIDHGKNNLTPMKNRTYLTTDLGYALIYAVGSNTIGTDYSDKSNKTGYIFKILKKDIKNRIPDEDTVGEIASKILDGDNYNFDIELIDELKYIVNNAFEYEIDSDEEEDEYMSLYDQFIDGRYDLWAAAGKIILRDASKRLLAKLRMNSENFSGEGNIPFSEAWVFNYADVSKMEKDGSNFFEFAKRVK